MADDFDVLVVPADSEIQDLDDFIAAWKENPRGTSIGGGSLGSIDHLLSGRLAQLAGIDPRRPVLVDECGAHTAMTRTYGRAPAGQRVYADTPGRWQSITLTCGLRLGGVTAALAFPGATNTDVFTRMREDMDLNAGGIVDGTATVQGVGEEIFEAILAVASGRPTVSEELDLGADEFVPWQLGAVT